MKPRGFVRLWTWGWMAIAHLIIDLVLAVPFLLVVLLLVVGLLTLPAMLVGLPFAVLALALAMLAAVVERTRIAAFAGVVIAAPPAPVTDSAWRRVFTDRRPWASSLYLLAMGIWGIVAGLPILLLTGVALSLAGLPLYQGALPGSGLAVPFGMSVPVELWPALTAAGLLGVLVLPLIARALVVVDVTMARLLLGRSRGEEVRELSARVETLTQTREAAVDSVEAERRRIERDLHDGPQQRLVALAMDLGLAQEKLDDDPAGARDLIGRAHVAAKEAITEIRQVARGIAPPVLTDRGLDAALSALAARSPVPVEVRVSVPGRPSPTLEAIAYFCVSEALTNIAKHSGAQHAIVDVLRADGFLTLRVWDDGRGGAAAGHGSGLTGLQDRVRAVDGTLVVDSPVGGPTSLTVRLPDRANRPPSNPCAAPSRPARPSAQSSDRSSAQSSTQSSARSPAQSPTQPPDPSIRTGSPQ